MAEKGGYIALEEHFLSPGFEDYFARTSNNINPDLFGKAYDALTDFGERRLAAMEAGGVEKAVLSISGPGVQAERDTALAVKRARESNDFLAEQISKNTDRYAGFAHLAMQDPVAAADELERTVSQLEFCGAMINGQTNGAYLDDDRYEVFWERAAALKAPIYIHPYNPPDMPYMYHDHPELVGPVWSWTVETANHALRLVFAGVFERHPDAKLILGHMGETLPYQLWRFDSRWAIANRGGRSLKLNPSDYIRRNIHLTTAGVFSDAPLRCAIDAMGLGQVMYSMDYPFEKADEAAKFLREAPLSEEERKQVGRENAARLLRLQPR